MPVLQTALEAARASGIPEDKIFLLDLPGYSSQSLPFKTVDNLIDLGLSLIHI